MGRHLNELKKLDKALAKFRDGLVLFLKVLEEKNKNKKNTDNNLNSFAIAYAYLNYNFALYLISKVGKAAKSDKIDKDFEATMKNFYRNK